jgi:hypothetical protein
MDRDFLICYGGVYPIYNYFVYDFESAQPLFQLNKATLQISVSHDERYIAFLREKEGNFRNYSAENSLLIYDIEERKVYSEGDAPYIYATVIMDNLEIWEMVRVDYYLPIKIVSLSQDQILGEIELFIGEGAKQKPVNRNSSLASILILLFPRSGRQIAARSHLVIQAVVKQLSGIPSLERKD